MEDGTTGKAGDGVPGAPRPKGRPGRKPKGTVPPVILETPDKPDPDHVLTWRQRARRASPTSSAPCSGRVTCTGT
jgi:hypothetical protein